MSATEELAPPALSPPALARPSGTSIGVGVWSAYRTERRKLATQLPCRALALLCVLGPVAFTAILKSQTGSPSDTIFGVWVHSSGFAIPLVVLAFAGSWGFPVLAGVLAGDIFSAEDRYSTWKTILTRSCRRRELFVGKVLAAATFSAGLIALLAASSLAAGLILVGDQSLVGLSGTLVAPGRCVVLVLASWIVSVLPMLGFASLAMLLSVATRNGIVGVLGTILAALVMQLLALVGTGTWVHELLLASAFDGWHGLFTTHPFYSQLLVACIASVAWITACLSAAWAILRRRDFAGTPSSRRSGWGAPLRAVVLSTALIAALAIASSWGPTGVTAMRLAHSIAPTFSNLTLLQQRLVGRTGETTANLTILAHCGRRSATSRGPGDDWYCTVDALIAQPGAVPFWGTPVTYDISVKSNGCYKAEAPPTSVGNLLMRDSQGHQVVNPLATIYGCFNTI
jgi:ABC-2 type transport system permease protein